MSAAVVEVRVSCDGENLDVSRKPHVRWAIAGLLIVAVGFLALHVREVARTGLAQPPVFAAPTGAQSYPVVAGRTVETSGRTDLEVGDVLVRVGDVDLEGAGYLGFMGHAFAEADRAGRVPVVYERAGARGETILELAPFAFPWLRVPFLSMMLLLVGLMLWRRPEMGFVQLTSVTFAAVVIGESIFEGGGPLQTTVAKSIFIFGGAVWWPLAVYFVARFPGDRMERERVAGVPWLAAAAAALWTLPKCMYLLGGPVPTPWIPAIVSGADALTILIPFGIFLVSYRRFDAWERRRVRWVTYTAWTAGLSMFVALMIPVLAPGFPYFGEVLAAAAVMAAIIPVGFTVAIVGYDVLDLDQLITSAASYSVLVASMLALLLLGVPAVSAMASSAFGVDPESGRVALSVIAACLIVPLHRWIQPRIDRTFFPERERIETGIDALIEAQARFSDPGELAIEAAKRVHALFGPRFTATFVQREAGAPFGLAHGEGDLDPGAVGGLEANAALVRRLAERATPLVVSERPVGAARIVAAEDLGAFLAEVRPALLLPIRERDELRALIAVGPKRSGDVYPPTELALLSAALEAAARHLGLAREAEAVARERLRSEALEAAQLTRSRHLAAASHDLRQPLHALRLFSEALQDRADDPEIARLAERVGASSSALHEMFDSLIDLSRIEQGALVTDVKPLPIATVFERLESEARLTAEGKGLTLEVAAPDVDVRSDAVLLGRILQNLLTNALRYTEKGGVRLIGRVEDGVLRVSVEDTGPGIPAAARAEVFEEFVRLDPGQSSRGLGLGLAIVRKMTDLLGHRLLLESEEGVGTTFTLDVPIVPRVEPPAPVAADPARSFEGYTILIADDDLDVLVGMRALLDGWGAEVVVAADGDEAEESLDGRDVDAIIADFRLGAENGIDVVQRLRARAGRDVPAVVVTGSTSQELAQAIEEAGLPMLPKPVSPPRLRAVLSGLVRRSA